MQKAVDDLAGILERQIKNYGTLKDLVMEERKAIMGGDLGRLSEVTLQIEELIGSNNQLEIARIDIAGKVAKSLGLSKPGPTLALIAEHIDDGNRERLLDLRHRAIDAILEIKRGNRINAEMLNYSAELTDSVLRRLAEAGSCDPTYGSTGEAKKKTASVSLLDHQI